jgi:hypothetical protein
MQQPAYGPKTAGSPDIGNNAQGFALNGVGTAATLALFDVKAGNLAQWRRGFGELQTGLEGAIAARNHRDRLQIGLSTAN